MSDDNGASLLPVGKAKRSYTKRAGGAITIEKGIEMPAATARQKYPWDAMEVGDSFFVPNAPKSLAGSCSKRSKDGPHEYAARTWTARGVKGLRVWRTK